VTSRNERRLGVGSGARDVRNAIDANPAQLVILPDPTVKLMPFVLGMMAMVWGVMRA
jgi:hypothetical protein